MKKMPSRYQWLIVVEGDTDAGVFRNLLVLYGIDSDVFYLFPAQGKSKVLKTNTWPEDLVDRVNHDAGRADFMGVILVVDTDEDSGRVFRYYERNPHLMYADDGPPADRGAFWRLGSLDGRRILPIYGIPVPLRTTGCLETDLLASYGFPTEGQKQYDRFTEIIKKATAAWNIPLLGGGGHWYDENYKAKMDKFIYAALAKGFKVSGKKPQLPREPAVISGLKNVMLSDWKGGRR